ncbi:MAG: methyltransferase [Gammaproteobacteria bacterium]|nr:methyltransferase [Gammaproteobacteria bacterium]
MPRPPCRTDPRWLEQARQDLDFTTALRGHPFRFRTTWGLFSPRDVDAGSRLLLDHLEVRPADRAFDLGCGYGPLGLAIARDAPQGGCLMVDKDFVAVEYARRNATLNHIDNVEVMLSDGFRHVGARAFDLVVSNLPAKTTKEHYYLFFHEACERLAPGGRFYVVVISGLRQFVARAFGEVFGNHEKVKQGRDYTVAMARREG